MQYAILFKQHCSGSLMELESCQWQQGYASMHIHVRMDRQIDRYLKMEWDQTALPTAPFLSHVQNCTCWQKFCLSIFNKFCQYHWHSILRLNFFFKSPVCSAKGFDLESIFFAVVCTITRKLRQSNYSQIVDVLDFHFKGQTFKMLVFAVTTKWSDFWHKYARWQKKLRLSNFP